MTTTKRVRPKPDPILIAKYPAITPMQAFRLLRQLDQLHGKRRQAGSGWDQSEVDTMTALANHVQNAMASKGLK